MTASIPIPRLAYCPTNSHRKDFVDPPSHYYVTEDVDMRRVVLAMTNVYLERCREITKCTGRDMWFGFEAEALHTYGEAAVARRKYRLKTCGEVKNGLFGLCELEMFRIEVQPASRLNVFFPMPRVLRLLTVRDSALMIVA